VFIVLRKLTTKEFITQAVAIHGDLYDYSESVYINKRSPITIICGQHGAFIQKPDNHINGGTGCPTCGIESRKTKRRKTLEQFILEANKIHDNKYTYSLVDYVNTDTHVIITCNEHGNFEQRPHDHLVGNGCPACASRGFNSGKPAILYYLNINDGEVYKIGITNRTVAQRFYANELHKIKVLQTIEYQYGADALKEEQRILKEFKHLKYIGPKLLSSGNTELFVEDVLNLDRKSH